MLRNALLMSDVTQRNQINDDDDDDGDDGGDGGVDYCTAENKEQNRL